MFSYLDAGFTTWDLADHYGPAEDFIGEFRRQLVAQRGIDALNNLQAFTKWVPRPGKMTKEIVAKNIAISLRRMDVDSLDTASVEQLKAIASRLDTLRQQRRES